MAFSCGAKRSLGNERKNGELGSSLRGEKDSASANL